MQRCSLLIFASLVVHTLAACGGQADHPSSSPDSGPGNADASSDATGGGDAPVVPDASCNGSLLESCNNGVLGTYCCPAGADCAVMPYCDLGGGACSEGACPTDAATMDGSTCPAVPPPVGGSCSGGLSCSYCDGGALCDCNLGQWECGGAIGCIEPHD